MNTRLIEAVLLAWLPIVAALFRAIGPSRAVLVGTLGGFLFLPVGQVRLGPPGFSFPIDKYNVTGLALILGVILFDRRTLFRARPGWPDLAMAAYYLAPLIGLVTGIPGSSADILDVMIGRGLGWVVVYAMGRIYFGRRDGPTQVAVALTISGLSYIPVCLYEEIAGPSRYLAGLIYQIPYEPTMVDRLGGWRPEGFLGNGLAVAAWMAMTTVMATWLWLGGNRLGRWPGWPSVVALLLATISCRGVYGYLLVVIGLGSAMLTRWARSRVFLVVLASLPILYMGLRATGAWDGKVLIQIAAMAGRESTVEFRLMAENELIRQVTDRNLVVGFGNYVWNAGLFRWPDGSWLHVLWMGGLVGLALQLTTFHILPASLALAHPRGRPEGWQAASPAWGLACWCIVLMIDGMHNTSYFPPTALVAGTLVGFAIAGRPVNDRTQPTVRSRGSSRTTVPAPLIITVILLIAIEVLGRSTARGPVDFKPPVLEEGSRKTQP